MSLKIHNSNAERQRAYRQRKRMKKAAAASNASLKEWVAREWEKVRDGAS